MLAIWGPEGAQVSQSPSPHRGNDNDAKQRLN